MPAFCVGVAACSCPESFVSGEDRRRGIWFQSLMRQNSPAQYFNRRPLATGAALAAVGSLLTMAGVLVSAASALAGVREWAKHFEQPPTDVVKVKWHQAKAAGSARADAWRHSSTRPRAS